MTNQTPPNNEFDGEDPIAKAWKRQSELGADAHIVTPDPAALAESVVAAHRKDQRLLVWLNVREMLPMLVMAAWFGSLVSDSVHPLSTAAAALVALVVGGFMAVSSIRHHQADQRWGASVRDQLERRLAQLEHRAWIYQNLAWWYFLPLALSVVLFWFGYSEEPTLSDGVFFFGIALAALVISYRVNRKIGRKKYDSEIERLAPLLADFDTAL